MNALHAVGISTSPDLGASPRGGTMNDSRRRRTAAASCLAVTGALLAAGCGGETAGSSTEASSSLKGAPVKVMVWAPENTQGSAQPGIRLTAQAYEKWINANGAIKGAPLKVLT